jgi:hypothetical protein
MDGHGDRGADHLCYEIVGLGAARGRHTLEDLDRGAAHDRCEREP